jgi:DNA-directed RNA polymerase specialized sigma24 family protein
LPTEDFLTSEQQYRSATRQLPRLSPEEEQEIIRRAKNGDAEAREQVITSCLTYVEFIAKRYERYLHHDDYLDLVGIGSLAVVENLERALLKDNPGGWLRSRAKYAIIHYCFTRANLIVRPDHKAQPVYTTSLDQPIYSNTLSDTKAPVMVADHPDYSCLYEALEQLPRHYQAVLISHYGLFDSQPESLYALSRRMKANVKGSAAYLTEYRALRLLRKYLRKGGPNHPNASAR